MTESIVAYNVKTKGNLPRAIAREKDGIVMYWVEELNKGGLHINGIARLLDCDPKSITQYMRSVVGLVTFEAEIVTDKGIKPVVLLFAEELQKLLRHIARSKSNTALRDRADDFRDKLAAAGFDLALALEFNPQQLTTQIQNYADSRTRELELENENLRLKDSLITLHGVEVALTLMGRSGQIVPIERVSTEIVNPATGRTDKILTADQLKAEVTRKTGQKPKSMKIIVDKLKAKGRDDLLVPVTRHSTSEYVLADRLDEAISVVYGDERQALLKNTGRIVQL